MGAESTLAHLDCVCEPSDRKRLCAFDCCQAGGRIQDRASAPLTTGAGALHHVDLYPGSWVFLTVDLPDLDPEPDGVTTFRTLKMRPGKAPSIAV